MMKNYYVCQQGGTPQGPFPEAMVLDAYAQGIYDNQTLLCEETASHWVYIQDAFAATTLRPRQAASSAKQYTWIERFFGGLFALFVVGSIGGILISLGLEVCGIIFAIITFAMFDCYDIKRKYGLTWKEARASSLSFLGIAVVCLASVFVISNASDISLKKPLIKIIFFTAIFARVYLLKKKYKNRR